MGFLLLSVRYPTEGQRQTFTCQVGPQFLHGTSPLHRPLSVSFSDGDWKDLLTVIHNYVTPLVAATTATAATESTVPLVSLWNPSDTSSIPPRPLKPNDDNYAAFVGIQWDPSPGLMAGVPPPLRAMVFDADRDAIPHYDRCAKCTQQPTTILKCSRCKMVQYCGRDCQSQHWKQCHRRSCIPAEPRCLYQVLQTNDGFWISPNECEALSITMKHLSQQQPSTTTIPFHIQDKMKHFATYMNHVAKLDGCFVL